MFNRVSSFSRVLISNISFVFIQKWFLNFPTFDHVVLGFEVSVSREQSTPKVFPVSNVFEFSFRLLAL